MELSSKEVGHIRTEVHKSWKYALALLCTCALLLGIMPVQQAAADSDDTRHSDASAWQDFFRGELSVI